MSSGQQPGARGARHHDHGHVPQVYLAASGVRGRGRHCQRGGMIEPNMATMLAYIMTDADLPPQVMRPMLRRVVDRSFNAISIDTDTSTSDVVLMANGLAGR